jgi:hypothetical protein
VGPVGGFRSSGQSLYEWGCTLIQEAQENSLSLLHVRMQLEVGSLQPGRGALPQLDYGGTLIPDFQPPEL